MGKQGWLLALFVLALGLVPLGLVRDLDLRIAYGLRPWGQSWPWLNTVWILGGIPVTTAVAVIVTKLRPVLWAQRFRILGAGVGGSLLELMCKHWMAIPNPPTVSTPSVWAHLVQAFNWGPGTVFALIHLWWPIRQHAVSHFFVGTFPSGHVFRSTFVAGLLNTRGGLAISLAVAIPVAIATIATGGHWFWDTVGGFLLAEAMLAGIRRTSHLTR